MRKVHLHLFAVLLAGLFVLIACTPEVKQVSGTDQLKVLATTSIVADVVAHIGGELIELSVLLPPGIDPHNFDPSPQDVAKFVEADVIFANGAGLEVFLEKIIENVEVGDNVVFVSEGIDLLHLEENHVEKPEIMLKRNLILILG